MSGAPKPHPILLVGFAFDMLGVALIAVDIFRGGFGALAWAGVALMVLSGLILTVNLMRRARSGPQAQGEPDSRDEPPASPIEFH